MVKNKKILAKKDLLEWKVNKIKELVTLYENGIKGFKPTKKDIEEYQLSLEKLKPKYLETIGKPFIKNISDTTNIIDIVKKLDSKYSCLAMVFMDNGTTDSFIVNEQGRTFIRKDKIYLIDPARGKQYTFKSSKLIMYFYFQNNPFPIVFEKNIIPEGIPDGILLKKVLHFEYLQALANAVRLNKKMDMLTIIGALGFVVSLATFILCLKGFGFI